MDPINYDENGTAILPQPDQLTKKEKEDAMGAYLMMFVSYVVGMPFPFINLIAATIYHILNSKESRFVAFHSLQSLLSQLLVSFLNGVFVIWTIRNIILFAKDHLNYFKDEVYLIFALFLVLINIVYTVYSIIALVKAKGGRFFYMMFFGRLAFAVYYKKADKEKQSGENTPPQGM